MISERPVKCADAPKEVPPVELSTNPVVRLVLKEQVELCADVRGTRVSEDLIDYEPLPSDAQECTFGQQQKELAIDRALLFMLFVQAPSAAASFFLSPSTEWEIIGGCAGALLLLKLWATAHRSLWVLMLGTVLANVVMGSLTGECLVMLWELADYSFDIPHLAGFGAVLLCAAAFYATLIGDVLFIKRTKRLKLSLSRLGERYVLQESIAPLTLRDRWWLTWGLSASSIWSPFHAFYLLMRFLDWFTSVVAIGFLRDLLMLGKRVKR